MVLALCQITSKAAARLLSRTDRCSHMQLLMARDLILQHPIRGGAVSDKGSNTGIVIHLTRFAPALLPGQYFQVPTRSASWRCSS